MTATARGMNPGPRSGWNFPERRAREACGDRTVPRVGDITWKSCAGPGSKFMALRDDFELANQRAKDLEGSVPRVVGARYDRQTGRVVIQLSSRLIVSFSPGDVEGLENAKAAQLSKIEISPSGFGIHFPAVDADVYVPGLLDGLLGSRRWMASRLGQIGGQSRSRAKKAASRANGKLGGRP